MKTYFIHKVTKPTFNVVIPSEFKKINGLFLYGNAVNAGKIAMNISGKIIIPKGFDAALIEFTGNIKRDDVLYHIKIDNTQQSLNFDVSTNGLDDFSIYFDVE